MAGKVTIIPSKINPLTHLNISGVTKRKVCAYARVSTSLDEQATSYDAQVDYYEKYIKSNPNYEFVNIYTDEGISGTNTKKRKGFNKMIEDALNGKIDLIITKSVSRFARNTVDSLVNIRKLKEHGVEVYFEKENIYTFDSKGELLLTIMSSMAQEESRSISENVKWGIRKSFQDGKVKIPFKNFLGYKKDDDGNIVIVKEEAKIVRRIYSMFINGYPIGRIVETLNNENILTPSKKTKWQYRVIDSILRNEKYKGSALLQKTYSSNFLTKEMKVNNGEIPKYYIEESHPPIIDKDEWEMVQQEIKLRDDSINKMNKSSIFASKIYCEECGSVYGAKVWHSNDKYRRVIYRCNNKYNNSHKCSTSHITESRIKELFIELVNKIFVNKDVILNDLELVKETLEVNDNNEITLLENKLKEIENTFKNNLANKLNNMNEYDALIKEYEEVEITLNKLIKDNEKRNATLHNISKLISDIKSLDTLPLEFDEVLFYRLVDKILITKDDKVIFITKDNNKYTFDL